MQSIMSSEPVDNTDAHSRGSCMSAGIVASAVLKGAFVKTEKRLKECDCLISRPTFCHFDFIPQSLFNSCIMRTGLSFFPLTGVINLFLTNLFFLNLYFNVSVCT